MTMKIRYTRETIATAVKSIAGKIALDFAGNPPVIVVVLKGALFFAADLIRHLNLPVTVDFVQLSSYRGTEPSGSVSIVNDLTLPIDGRDVLVVEDIIDTGLTLQFLLDHLRVRGVQAVKVCSLLDKPSRRMVPVVPDYVGITVEDHFLVGYGLDLDEQFRHLPDIYEIVPENA